MRKLKIIEHMSLDGVIQNSRDDDDFPYSNWTAAYRSPAGLALTLAAHGEHFDLLLGRRTYDLGAAFWPQAPSGPMSDRLNAATKYVVTRRPESLGAWGPVEGVAPDLVDAVRRLKAQNGPGLILFGSSTLTSLLLEHGLVDEMFLAIYPVLLGKGKRLFGQGAPPHTLALESTQALPSGVVVNTYTTAGALPSQGQVR